MRRCDALIVLARVCGGSGWVTTRFYPDMVEDRAIESHVAAGFSPIYAGVPSHNQATKILDRLNSQGFCRLDHVCLTVPSYDKQSPGYSPTLYWRGPIWINVNYLLYHGLRHYGLNDYAERVKSSILTLTSNAGMYEYYDPETGNGHGASGFSWTAALLFEEAGLE